MAFPLFDESYRVVLLKPNLNTPSNETGGADLTTVLKPNLNTPSNETGGADLTTVLKPNLNTPSNEMGYILALKRPYLT